MSRTNDEELERAIAMIADENRSMALGLTTDEIRALVGRQLGNTPSRSTVARVLRRIGIDTKEKGRVWFWQHNKGKHE